MLAFGVTELREASSVAHPLVGAIVLNANALHLLTGADDLDFVVVCTWTLGAPQDGACRAHRGNVDFNRVPAEYSLCSRRVPWE